MMQMACFLQSEDDAPRNRLQWIVVPSPKVGSYAQVRDRLANLDEPVLIGILNHPGYLALWRIRQLDPQERMHAEHNLQNQQNYLDAKLAGLPAASSDRILFEGRGIEVTVPAAELRECLGRFALTWGWTISRPTNSDHQARIGVWQNARKWSPGLTSGCSV